MSYPLGTTVRVKATFKDEDGHLIDPTVVQCKYKGPSVGPYTRTYPTDITRVSQGVYRTLVEATAAGLWNYRWQSSGNCVCAVEGTFTIDASAFSYP